MHVRYICICNQVDWLIESIKKMGSSSLSFFSGKNFKKKGLEEGIINRSCACACTRKGWIEIWTIFNGK